MTLQKKLRFVGLLASLFIVSNSFSQPSNVENLHFSLGNISYHNTNTNAVAAFKKLFVNAENVSWHNVNKHFLVKFTVNDLMYKALFNQKGKLIYKISHGKEKHLPTDIRKMVKGNYVEYLITAAYLVEEADRKIWVISLEDDTNYVTVSVEDDQMNENLNYKKYNKSVE